MRLCKVYVTRTGSTLHEKAEDFPSQEAAASSAASDLSGENSAIYFETLGGFFVAIRSDQIDHIGVVDPDQLEAALREAEEL